MQDIPGAVPIPPESAIITSSDWPVSHSRPRRTKKKEKSSKKRHKPEPCDWKGDRRETEVDDLAHSAVDTGDACSWKGDPAEADTDDLAHGKNRLRRLFGRKESHVEPAKEDTPRESPESRPASEQDAAPSAGAARSRQGSEGRKSHRSGSTKTVTHGMLPRS